MKTRILSGVILVLVCAAIVVFNGSFPLILNIVIALISAEAVYELCHALGLLKKYFLSVPSIIFAAFIPFITVVQHTPLVIAVYIAVMCTVQLKEHQSVSFKDISVLTGMSIVISLGLATLVLLRDVSGERGMFAVIMTILAAWAADVGAYFFGVLFGKHKLCPIISPKKTVEGAVGGLVVNTAAMLLFGWFYSYFWNVPVSYLTLALMGLVGAPVSVLGDLTFSLVKRSCNIKDFSQLIPGHGGMLDRFDSVIFVAPFVYFLIYYLPLFV